MLGDEHERGTIHANPSWSTRNFHRTHARLVPPRRQRESHPPLVPVDSASPDPSPSSGATPSSISGFPRARAPRVPPEARRPSRRTPGGASRPRPRLPGLPASPARRHRRSSSLWVAARSGYLGEGAQSSAGSRRFLELRWLREHMLSRRHLGALLVQLLPVEADVVRAWRYVLRERKPNRRTWASPPKDYTAATGGHLAAPMCLEGEPTDFFRNRSSSFRRSSDSSPSAMPERITRPGVQRTSRLTRTRASPSALEQSRLMRPSTRSTQVDSPRRSLNRGQHCSKWRRRESNTGRRDRRRVQGRVGGDFGEESGGCAENGDVATSQENGGAAAG